MALSDVRLSILAFPQRWSAGSLELRVLLLPAGDPTQSSASLPAFAGTSWALTATVLPGRDSLFAAGPTAGVQTKNFAANCPAIAVSLFNALGTFFPVAPSTRTTAERLASTNSAEIRKDLPSSYTDAFPFERPGPGTTVGNEFGCALRDVPPATSSDPKPPATITWGAVLSFALRQPVLARALGLIYDLTVPLHPANALEAGGWLYVGLDPAGPVKPLLPDSVRAYSARLPFLGPDDKRNLFAAVLFPVGLTAAGDYGQALAEAAVYDDGFAKIMHASQALTADATSDGHNKLQPAVDAGIDLGWDDEQITLWLNRQLDGLRSRLDPSKKVVEAPLGVGGYRIDVRSPDNPALKDWESLCRAFSVDAAGDPAPLQFPPPPAAPVLSTDFDDELSVEPAAVRSIHATDGVAWLPRYFTRWQDGSLVVNDTTLFQIAGTSPRDAKGKAIDVQPPTYGAPPVSHPLRYGQQYDFRCRFVDLTGGGPLPDDKAINPAPHPTSTIRFLRHVPPKSVRIATDIPKPNAGQPTPSVPTVNTIKVWRPLMGYPEMVFAGIDDQAVIKKVIAAAPAAKAANDAIGVNDPDVTHLAISVQVRAPGNDPGPEGVRDGIFREIYNTRVAFPAFDKKQVLKPGTALKLTLSYLDVADIAQMKAPPASYATTLPVPRSRDVRLRLTPICADKRDYFGSDAAKTGLTVDVATRSSSVSEANLYAPLSPDQSPLTAIMLQPAADMVQRFVDQFHLRTNGLTLTARPGERVLFGASGGLRHTIDPDGGSITFAADSELLNQWIVAVQVQLQRDWTWDAIDEHGFVVSHRNDTSGVTRVRGQIRVPLVAPTAALLGPDVPYQDRRAQTRIIFFDAVDPRPTPGAFPTKPALQWTIRPGIRGFSVADNVTLSETNAIQLPVAVPPRQTPKLIAAGVALSPYERDTAYSSTTPRKRVLWFEFDSPVEDPNDAVYARILAYGPDPLLSGTITHMLVPTPDVPVSGTTWFEAVQKLLPTPPTPPDLAIDPEPIRVIVPNQPEDKSGLDAMMAMIEAVPPAGEKRARHFMVPLPPGVQPDTPEMFGFWTYEIRVGHTAIWSTAQARFGRPLIVKGVQHPAPTLQCTAIRLGPTRGTHGIKLPARIVIAAPHATAVFEGGRLTQPRSGDPRTQIWVLLYAQVTQADGVSQRNILIARAPAIPQIEQVRDTLTTHLRDVLGVAEFDEQTIEMRLSELALPVTARLSAIAVELLPGGHLIQRSVQVAEGTLYYTYDTPSRPGSPGVGEVGQLFTPGFGIPNDPLGRELGSITTQRILRCSPLTAVPAHC